MSRVTIIEDSILDTGSIEIHCKNVTSEIKQIKSYAEQLESRITAKNKDEKHLVIPSDIYYIESIDKRTFLYLNTSVLETELRLYQLEELLDPMYFIRISKSCIVNISYVKSISLMINRNLELTLNNKEKLIVSRRYVKDFNQLLEME